MSFSKHRFIAAYKQLLEVRQCLKMFTYALLRELNEGGLKLRAMSLVYTSLLSLAPLLAVSFSILKGFGIHNQMEPLLLELLAPLGAKGVEITANIVVFVGNIQVGVLGFVGFLMLFYTVVSLLSEIEASFNHIWRVAKSRPLYRRFSDYLSMVLIGPVLLFSGIGIAASMSNLELVRRLIAVEPFGTVYYLIGLLLPYVLIALAFGFAYSFIPNTTVKLRPALIGGLIAGSLWKFTGMLFAEFIADSSQYSAIYSGFAAILLAMIWLYVSWLILLIGSAIVFHIQFPRYLRYAVRRPQLSIQCREQLGVLLLALIGRQHLHGGPAFTLRRLADYVDLSWEPVAEILACLTRHGFLMTLRDDENSYVLTQDTDAIFLKDVVNAIRMEGYQADFVSRQSDAGPAIRTLLLELEQHTGEALRDRRLRDVID